MLTIGEAMEKARVDRGFSRQALSYAAHVPVTNIYYWEIGKTFPNITSLIPVADALNVSLDELVGRRCER